MFRITIVWGIGKTTVQLGGGRGCRRSRWPEPATPLCFFSCVNIYYEEESGSFQLCFLLTPINHTSKDIGIRGSAWKQQLVERCNDADIRHSIIIITQGRIDFNVGNINRNVGWITWYSLARGIILNDLHRSPSFPRECIGKYCPKDNINSLQRKSGTHPCAETMLPILPSSCQCTDTIF